MPANPFIIGLQGDPTTWALPPAGKTAFGVNLAGQFCSLQSNGTITILNLGTVSAPTGIVNAGGVSTVVVENPITTQKVTVSGSARNVPIVLSEAGAGAGDVIRLKLYLASTAGLVIQVYDGSTSGALLYTFTTDGTGQTTAAYAEFSYDGTEWTIDFARLPNL